MALKRSIAVFVARVLNPPTPTAGSEKMTQHADGSVTVAAEYRSWAEAKRAVLLHRIMLNPVGRRVIAWVARVGEEG